MVSRSPLAVTHLLRVSMPSSSKIPSRFRPAMARTPTVLGQWSGGLSNNGETVVLADASGEALMTVSYDDAAPWAARADGAGGTLELANPGATPTDRYSKADSWRGSTDFGGSPGTAGTAPLGVVINEVLTHTAPPLTVSDSIELFNATDQAINIGGWYLSDAADAPFKFKIPTDTVLAPGEYVVFDESDFNPTPLNPGPNDFALSGDQGDDVWLVVPGEHEPEARPSVRLFADDAHFGAALNGVSFGRVERAGDQLSPLSTTSLGCVNAHPSVGPLVISEVHYAPEEPSTAALAVYPNLTAGDLEFLEIYNPTSTVVDLTDWRIRGGVDYDFDAGTMIPAGETAVLIRFNPANAANADRVSALRTHYGIDPSTRILGGFSGQISNEGERITLQRPDAPPLDDPTFTPRVIEDEVIYDNLQPWPVIIAGQSLQRQSAILFGNASNSWTASTATPGSIDFVPGLLGDLTGDNVVDTHDIDLLNALTTRGTTVGAYDLDGNGAVNADDREFLVSNVLGTFLGRCEFGRPCRCIRSQSSWPPLAKLGRLPELVRWRL